MVIVPQKNTHRIGCDETGKGRSLSLSRSNSMQKNQKEERTDLSVTLRSCDLDVKTKRIIIQVLGMYLSSVTHITYQRKFVRRGFHDIHWKTRGKD